MGKKELSNLNHNITLSLPGMISISTVILFICGSLRHFLLQSHALAAQTAISLVKTKGDVLTTGAISTHLSHRQLIKLAYSQQPLDELTQFDYILLDTRYPGFGNTPESASIMVNFLRSHADFNLEHEGNDIYLFHRK